MSSNEFDSHFGFEHPLTEHLIPPHCTISHLFPPHQKQQISSVLHLSHSDSVVTMASAGFDVNAHTSLVMLTKSIQRDVYPAVDPIRNPDLRADNKVILITGGAGGLGFVSYTMALDQYSFLGSELTILFRALPRLGLRQEPKESF